MKHNHKIKYNQTNKQKRKYDLRRSIYQVRISFGHNPYKKKIKEKLSEIITWNLSVKNNLFGHYANRKKTRKVYKLVKKWKNNIRK